MTVRVGLDTNVWSYIADDGSVAAIKDLNRRDVRIVVPPCTLREVLQLSREDIRARIVGVLTDATWYHTASEAELESAEVVSEVRRLRSDWLRPMPDTGKIDSLHKFWTRRFWREARSEAGASAFHRHVKADTASDAVLTNQKENRTEALKNKFDTTDLTNLVLERGDAEDTGALQAWDGTPRAAWRVELLIFFWHQLHAKPGRAFLSGEDTTFADWIGSYVDLRYATRNIDDWTNFWLEEVDPNNTQRNWLRWALNWTQMAQKVGQGNPVDNQYAPHLLDFDLFITADARFAKAIEVVRSHTSFAMAEVRCLKRTSDALVGQQVAEIAGEDFSDST